MSASLSPEKYLGCSSDCQGCSDLSFIADRCGPDNDLLKPPVVLIGEPPSSSVINIWPPFGCSGKGDCRKPICNPIKRKIQYSTGDPNYAPNRIHCKQIQFPVEMLLNMNELRHLPGSPLCDVKIQAGTLIFPAHRIVLAASSPYFRAMFTRNMREAHQEIVHIENVCPRILGKLLDFCYTSEITISDRYICKILPAAVMLQLQRVVDCCCHFLQSQLDPCNAIGIMEFANQHGCTTLTGIVREFIDKNFAEVSKSEEFLQLSVCQLINLIKRDELVVDTESEVYHAVMRWIKHDEKVRRVHLEDIIYAIRCYFLSPNFLAQQIKSCDVLNMYPQCRQYLERIMTDLAAHKKCQMRKRRNPDLPSVIYIAGGFSQHSLNRLETFDPRTNTWKALQPMPSHRNGVCTVFVYGLLYVIGGRCMIPSRPGRDLNDVDAYDPITQSWRSCTPMSAARNRAAAAAVDNHLYVIGGASQIGVFDTCERYNTYDETWTPVNSMRQKRTGLGVACLNKLLYAVGGFDGEQRLNSVERYDPEKDEWQYVASMHCPRGGCGVVALEGMIYAIGGYDGQNQLGSVERYDPDANQWDFVAPMPTPRSALAAVVVDGKIYTIGGFNGEVLSAAVESYDPDLNEWAKESSLPKGRSGHAADVWWGSCTHESSQK